VTYGCHSSLAQLVGAGKVLEQMPGDGTVPELVEAGGEARQAGFEVVADLAVESSAFADEIATLADEQEQGGPGFVARASRRAQPVTVAR